MHSVIIGLLMLGSVLTAPTPNPPEATNKISVESLLKTFDEVKILGGKMQAYIDSTLTESDFNDLYKQLAELMDDYQQTSDELDEKLLSAGIEAEVLSVDDEELSQRYMSVLSHETDIYNVDMKEKISLVLGDRFGRQAVRMRILTGLISHVMSGINELTDLIGQISLEQDYEGDLIVLANLLTDLKVDVAVLDAVFVKISDVFEDLKENDLIAEETNESTSDDVTKKSDDVIIRHRRALAWKRNGSWSLNRNGLNYNRGRTTVTLGGLNNGNSRDMGGRLSVKIRF